MAQNQGGKGNFANDPERAAEAGKKGGKASSGKTGSKSGTSQKSGRKS